MARHLAAGDVWGLDTHGELAGLAMICRTEGENAIDIGYVDGTEEALTSILQGLRGLAAQRGQTDVRVKSVDEPALTAAVEAAGYERYRDHDLWIFELRLEEKGKA